MTSSSAAPRRLPFDDWLSPDPGTDPGDQFAVEWQVVDACTSSPRAPDVDRRIVLK